jgi:glutamate-ammonia-ligase adenylyltransferase
VTTPSDLFLSPDLTETQARAFLQSLGFRDAAAADEHLQRMAEDLVVREALGRLAPDLVAALLESPDPDASLAAMAQYVSARSGRAMFVDYLHEDPRALHVLTYVMGASPKLGEILVHTPEYFHWLVAQVERSAPDRQDHEEELASALAALDDPAEALDFVRRWKRRETLRIGTRYLLRHETVQTASAQLSDVASVVIDVLLETIMRRCLEAAALEAPPGTFAVIATGALGAGEMSYEPAIDVLYVYDCAAGAGPQTDEFFVKVGCDLTAALNDDTSDGLLYRVQAPLRPQRDGRLNACSLTEYADRFRTSSEAAERLTLIRARPVAGDSGLAARFMSACHAFVFAESSPARFDREYSTAESLTQMLQLRFGAKVGALRDTGTLGALDLLARSGLIDQELCRELERAYVFLQSAEHRSQLGVPEDVQKQVEASKARVGEICRSIGRLVDW